LSDLACPVKDAARCKISWRRLHVSPHVIEFDDRDADDELRFNAIGLVDGRMLFVTYTMRAAVVRIISARGAEPNEKRKYNEL
jgi:uncharacterized DUF497 family protein